MMSDRDQIRQKKIEELRKQVANNGSTETVDDRNEPIHVESGDHFNDLLAEDGVVLADFYADWCGPCQMLEPVVEELAAETDATVAKIDVDQLQQLAQQYRVQGVPTMYLFDSGEQVERMVGVQQKDELRSLISQYA
ncbi:thioredoxin [Halorubrum sp. SD626R]|jgi:thioredoxin 1|uniref:thioredoxin n=1 Tax=Halorubrum sp. SD626R TaxID=1419722 RepID=UPI000A8F6963|nr:thioredoxin [Halorubrum sp. SD626R]